jgi:phosphate transport system substrate-binding protein
MKAATLALCGLLAAPLWGAELAPPVMQSDHNTNAVLSIWGQASLRPVARVWGAALARERHGLRLDLHMDGSALAMAGLYTGRADVALLGRDATDSELKAFEWVYHHAPTRVEIGRGSAARPGRSPALVFFVQRDNPLRGLTLAQAEAIFGAELKRGAPVRLQRWEQLGVSGLLAGQAIHAYAPDLESGTGRFFQRTVLGGSGKLNWEILREVPGSGAGAKLLALLARDPQGIAVAARGDARPGVRELQLLDDRAAPLPLSDATVVAGTYPLARTVIAYVNRPPGGEPTPAVAEFLRHALSESGQLALRASGYLPVGGAP